MACGIYKIKNTINGKVYIGQSINIERRWAEHKSDSKTKDNVLYRAIRKYGIDKFKFSVIEKCKEEELSELEIYYIEKYNSCIKFKDSNGYNMTMGGESTKGESNPRAKVIYCEGIRFGCVDDCAKYYNIKVGTMYGWISKRDKMPKNFYDLELHEEGKIMDFYEIQLKKDERSEKRRISKTGIPNTNTRKRVYCDGMEFEYIDKCAKYYGMNKNTMKKWVNGSRNMPKEWYDRKLHIEGKRMEDYKIQTGFLYGKNNPNYGKQISEKQKEILSKVHSNIVICQDKEFKNVNELCSFYNVNSCAVRRYLNGNSPMPKYWYDKGLRYKNKDIKYRIKQENTVNYNAKSVVCDGKLYIHISDCSQYYEINKYSFYSWLKGKNKMPQKFIDLGLRYATQEEIEEYEKNNTYKVS